MSKIDVVIIDSTGNKSQEVTVPDDIQVEKIIPRLVIAMNLPTTDISGNQQSYKFQLKRTGKQLLGTETLKEAGARNGDVIRLLVEMIAG